MQVKNLYTFQVWDELKKGMQVRMVDYVDSSIRRLDRLTVREAANIIKAAEENEGMYDFYELVEDKEDTNNE